MESRVEGRPNLGEGSYGSDRDGLVCAYAFAPGGPGRSTDTQTALDWLKSPSSHGGGFVWLHFNLSNAASERWMEQNLSLPEAFTESLHEESGSTRIEQDGDSLVAVINDVLFDFAFDVSHVSSVCLCADQRLFVSARSKPLRSVDRLRAAVRDGETFRSPTELLAHLLRDQAEALVRIARDATARVDAIEDQLLARRVTSSRRDLGALRRVLARLQRLLAPEPAALFRLLSRPPSWLGEADVGDLR